MIRDRREGELRAVVQGFEWGPGGKEEPIAMLAETIQQVPQEIELRLGGTWRVVEWRQRKAATDPEEVARTVMAAVRGERIATPRGQATLERWDQERGAGGRWSAR